MKILISQQMPSNFAAYEKLQSQFGAELDFRPFFLIEPLSAKEFRAEHISLPDYTAIVFSSRHAIDAYFKLCEEMRFKVPETMKYFCSTEAVAMYLQKHIVYRKRKIFYGTGTPASIVALVTAKHKGEKFLITASEGSNTTPITTLFSAAGLDYTVGILVKAVSQDLKDVDLSSYGLAVLCNPADVVSLHDNFPGFAQVHLLRQGRRQGPGGRRLRDCLAGPDPRGHLDQQGRRTLSPIPAVDAFSASPYSLQGGTAVRKDERRRTPFRREMGRDRAPALLLGRRPGKRPEPHHGRRAQADLQAGGEAQPAETPHPRSLPPAEGTADRVRRGHPVQLLPFGNR